MAKKIKIKIIEGLIILLIVLIGIWILYNGKLTGKVINDSGNYSNNFSVSLINESLKNSDGLIINDIEQRGSSIVVNYTFNNSDFVGAGASVDLWILDENNSQVKKVVDSFLINKDGLIERELKVNIENFSGVYRIYLAISGFTDNPIKESVVLTKPITGNVVIDETGNRNIGYAFFGIVILIALFFVVKSYWDSSPKEDSKYSDEEYDGDYEKDEKRKKR